MDLDIKDRKILYELSKNARLTNKGLGKKVGLHKDTVAYRIKQLTNREIISGHTIFYDFSKLGYRIYKLYFKFRGITAQELNQLAKDLKDDKLVGWLVLCNGKWDMVVGILTKSIEGFYQKKQEIEQKSNRFIEEMKVTTHIQASLYSRNYFVQKSKTKEVKIFTSEKLAKIDKKDLSILNILAKDSRMSVVDIAKKTKLTARVVAYRIKALEKAKIILQYRSSINLEKLGYIFVKSFIKLQNVTTQDHRRILQYCKSNPNIIHNVECLGDWDIEPEFEVSSIEDFYKIINEMRDLFSKNIKNIDSTIINREFKYQYVPSA